MVRQTNKSESPYSKMYLVTPMVYEKLKQCLNKVDRIDLGNLNKKYVPKLKVDRAEKHLQQISNDEFKPDNDGGQDFKKKFKAENKQENLGEGTSFQPTKNRQENLGEGTSFQPTENRLDDQFDLSQKYMDDYGESELYLENDENEISDDSFEFGYPLQPIRSFQNVGTQTDTDFKTRNLGTSKTEQENIYPRLALPKPLGRSEVHSENIFPTQPLAKRLGRSDVHSENIYPNLSFSKPKMKESGSQRENIEEIPRGFKPMVETSDSVTQTDKADLIYRQPVMSIGNRKKHKMIEQLLNQAKAGSSKYPIVKSKPKKVVRIKLRGTQTLITPRPTTSNSNWVSFNAKPSISTKIKPAIDFHGIRGKKDTLKYQCEICQKMFSRKYAVERHKKSIHFNRRESNADTHVRPISHELNQLRALTQEPQEIRALTHEPEQVRALTYEPSQAMALNYQPEDMDSTSLQPYEYTDELPLRVTDQILQGPSKKNSDVSSKMKRGKKYQLVRPKKKLITKEKVYDLKTDQDRFESWDLDE